MNLIFPFYHTISDDTLPHIRHLYPQKSIVQFEKELDYLLKYYQPIDLSDLRSIIRSNQYPAKKSFFLSFDDGLSECYSIIAPILKRKGVPAMFFINSGFVDNKALFYRYKVGVLIENIKSKKPELVNNLLKFGIHDEHKIDEIALESNVDFQAYLDRYKPYMTTEELSLLVKDGFYLGGHSVNHPYYHQISLEEQISQTKESIDFVTDLFNLDYRIFSFPFADHGVPRDFFTRVHENKIAEITFGTAGIKEDELPFHFQRLPMDNCIDSVDLFMKKNLIKYRIQKVLGKQVVRR